MRQKKKNQKFKANCRYGRPCLTQAKISYTKTAIKWCWRVHLHIDSPNTNSVVSFLDIFNIIFVTWVLDICTQFILIIFPHFSALQLPLSLSVNNQSTNGHISKENLPSLPRSHQLLTTSQLEAGSYEYLFYPCWNLTGWILYRSCGDKYSGCVSRRTMAMSCPDMTKVKSNPNLWI